MGDINARTGDQESDFIPNEGISDRIPLFENYTPDMNIPTRYSMDHTISSRGQALLKLFVCADRP